MFGITAGDARFEALVYPVPFSKVQRPPALQLMVFGHEYTKCAMFFLRTTPVLDLIERWISGCRVINNSTICFGEGFRTVSPIVAEIGLRVTVALY